MLRDVVYKKNPYVDFMLKGFFSWFYVLFILLFHSCAVITCSVRPMHFL
jgi:hypothetical protein